MNWISRIFRRYRNQTNYILLYVKVARRLGIARANARRYKQERDYLRGRCQELRVANYNLRMNSPESLAAAGLAPLDIHPEAVTVRANGRQGS
jgi:hypothetical protein